MNDNLNDGIMAEFWYLMICEFCFIALMLMSKDRLVGGVSWHEKAKSWKIAASEEVGKEECCSCIVIQTV